jgi:hypothetical protein
MSRVHLTDNQKFDGGAIPWVEPGGEGRIRDGRPRKNETAGGAGNGDALDVNG